MFKQQILGAINLSFPLILLYNINPDFLQTIPGIITGSLFIGIAVWYLNWKQLRNLTTSLKFIPSAENNALFIKLIQECHIDPNTIELRYAYTNEGIAMMADRMLIIDPVVWNLPTEDSDASHIQTIFENTIKHTLTEEQKQRIASIKDILTLPAQRFIFKHELGHAFHNFSQKKLVLTFFIGFLSAACATLAAIRALPIHGIIAGIIGIVVGAFCDLFFTFISNYLWKVHEEKKADLFAARYSSTEDIQAASYFFEKHQELLEQFPDLNTIISKLPIEFKSGHPNGKTRAQYLLGLNTHETY